MGKSKLQNCVIKSRYFDILECLVDLVESLGITVYFQNSYKMCVCVCARTHACVQILLLNNRPERLACFPTFLKILICVSREHRSHFRYAYVSLGVLRKGTFLDMAALDFQPSLEQE